MTGPSPTLRQQVEGMTLGFDLGAAPGRAAVLEFEAPAEQPRHCHLVVDERGCRFATGPAPSATLRLRTDGATWRAIGAGELDAPSAIADGRLSAEGDAGTLVQLRSWFRRVDPQGLRDPARQPPGPVRLPAMAWLAVAFLPWKAFWVGIALGHPVPAAAIGAGCAVALVAYRRYVGALTTLELGTALSLTAAVPAALLGATAGTLVAGSFAALAAIWALAAAVRPLALSGEYVRWRYVPALSTTALFRYPNVLLSLLWAGTFLAAAWLSAAPLPGVARTVASATIFVAASVATARHERRSPGRRIDDIDRRLMALRRLAWAAFAGALASLAFLAE